MTRIVVALGLFCFSLPAVGMAEPPSSGTAQAQLDGVKVGKVPPAVYAQLPKLPEGKGILLLEVAPGSFAAQAGLKQYDVLLTLGHKALKSSDTVSTCVTLPLSTKSVPVVLFRAGREITLHIAPVRLLEVSDPGAPKAMLKPGGPPTVSVDAKPLQGNQLKVTFTFFANGSKLERVNCSGSVDEIKKQVKDLGQQKRIPQQVEDLADVVLERLRVLNSQPKKE
jgi:hypothetical protein